MSDQELVVGLEKAMKAVKEAIALRGGADEMVLAPTCRLDMGTYRLMAHQATWGKYGEYLSKAVQQVRPWLDAEKIRLTSTLVKASRVGGNSQIVRARIRPEDLKWGSSQKTENKAR